MLHLGIQIIIICWTLVGSLTFIMVSSLESSKESNFSKIFSKKLYTVSFFGPMVLISVFILILYLTFTDKSV